jgi:sugar lactone lactonase YvrE
MKRYSCTPLVNLHNALGEGPVWDERAGVLYWLDSLGCRWFKRAEDGSIREFPTPSPIGSMALAEDGLSAIAGLRKGVYRIDLATGAASFYANPEAGVTGNRFNDGKADPAGRYLVGTMSESANNGVAGVRTGALYAVEPGGACRKVRGDVGISNGLAWSAAGDKMYYVDSAAGCVFAYDYDVQTGGISGERVAVRIPAGEGIPDGMAIDEDGNLWVAQWGGWCVSCYDPATGEKLAAVDVPVKHVTCCVFGGERMDELYITTSTNGVEGVEWLRQPLAGALFTAKPGVRGPAAFRFRLEPEASR